MIHDNSPFSGNRPGTGAAEAGEIYPAAPSFVPVAAMEAVLALRVRQIEEFGHTPESDAAAPLAHFANELRLAAQAFAEDVQFNKPTDHMHRHLVKLGALALAAIDRVAIIPFPTSQTGEHHG